MARSGAPRKIIHIDCDCFYAAVEMRDDPRLRTIPLAVGGRPEQRGVIATCNYVARRWGIHSAMPSRQALERCPDLHILPPDMPRYREAAAAVRAILERYTERIEPLSLDEAYLDVTGSDLHRGSATRMAEAMRREVRNEVGITASAGVAPNKFLAKVASDWHKPDGLFVIAPDQVAEFVAALPVTRLPGVGQVTGARLQALGLITCADLQRVELVKLVREFGSHALRLHQLAQGIDERAVQVHRPRKSVSVERTHARDLPDVQACLATLPDLLRRLQQRLDRAGRPAVNRQFVKLRFDNFRQTTMECAGTGPDLTAYRQLCQQAWLRGRRPVRLVGIGVRLADDCARQLSLFDEPDSGAAGQNAPTPTTHSAETSPL